MKNTNLLLDPLQHPLLAASAKAAATYVEALQENTGHFLRTVNRVTNLSPNAEFIKSAAEELSALQSKMTSCTLAAHQKASEVLVEQTTLLIKQLKDLTPKAAVA